MKDKIQNMIHTLRDKGDSVTAEDIADLAEMFEDVSVKDCDDMLDRVTDALVAVMSLDALKSFNGKTVTPETLAVLLQSPNIQNIPIKDTYEITDKDETTIYRICVVQVVLIDDSICCYISITKYKEEEDRGKAN